MILIRRATLIKAISSLILIILKSQIVKSTTTATRAHPNRSLHIICINGFVEAIFFGNGKSYSGRRIKISKAPCKISKVKKNEGTYPEREHS